MVPMRVSSWDNGYRLMVSGYREEGTLAKRRDHQHLITDNEVTHGVVGPLWAGGQ